MRPEKHHEPSTPFNENAPRDYLEIGAAFLIVTGVLLALAQSDLSPPNFGVGDSMSYGLIFVIGLVASRRRATRSTFVSSSFGSRLRRRSAWISGRTKRSSSIGLKMLAVCLRKF
jgi:hypothetical protein